MSRVLSFLRLGAALFAADTRQLSPTRASSQPTQTRNPNFDYKKRYVRRKIAEKSRRANWKKD